MTSRERVMRALAFEETDRLPLDLGGMRSTGISAFAYPKLVAHLGLPPRRPRIHDTGQMLALPDRDVLDALGCDVIAVEPDLTNAFDRPDLWHDYDFNGRLPAQVCRPQDYQVLPDGSIRQQNGSLMVPDSTVFDAPHGGQALNLDGDIQKEDLGKLQETLVRRRYTPADVARIAEQCRRAAAATERAVFFNGFTTGLGYRGGMADFSILCLTEPEYVRDLHTIVIDHMEEQARRLLPAIAPHVDILMFGADDQGTQNATILPPPVFRDLFAPFYKRANDVVHGVAPRIKTFLHSCGAIYDILDDIIAAGFDALNPVQWSAGGRSYREWKDVCRGRIALWGGGINTQSTLPLGTVAQVEAETREVVSCLAGDSGYVFCAIHNLLAEIPPEKVVALYRTAAAVRTR